MSRRYSAASASTASIGIKAASAAPLLILVTAILAAAAVITPSSAFTAFKSSCPSKSSLSRHAATSIETINLSDTQSSAISNAKQQINLAITANQPHSEILSHLTHLESLSPLTSPARHPLMDGPWVVLYTDAPPPSNGQLGIFQGVAKQVIDLDGGTYKNELYVGGKGRDGDEGAWLSAVLEATWSEWDGRFLDSLDTTTTTATTAASSNNVDYGATTWKVDFVSLTLSIFQLPIFTQKFQEGTARTWKMTYLDEETRIVRAGKTGREEDDWIFYMRRGERKG